jgi:hypothetical protein
MNGKMTNNAHYADIDGAEKKLAKAVGRGCEKPVRAVTLKPVKSSKNWNLRLLSDCKKV